MRRRIARPAASAPHSLTQLQADPRYIAPEQTGRIPRRTDLRTDLYSLGALLYHVVTGKPPFDGTEVLELLHAHLARLPPPPHALDDKIPEPFSKMIMKLLAMSSMTSIVPVISQSGPCGIPVVL